MRLKQLKRIERVRVNRPDRQAVGEDFIRYEKGCDTLSLYFWRYGNLSTEPLSWEQVDVPYSLIRGVHLSRQYRNDFRIYLPDETIHCLSGTSHDTRPLIEAIRNRSVRSICSAQDYYQADIDEYFAYLETSRFCVLFVNILKNDSQTAQWMAEVASPELASGKLVMN